MKLTSARNVLLLGVALTGLVWQPSLAAAKEKVPSRITWSNRTINLNGSISRQMIQTAQRELLEFDEKGHEPVWLRINSGGGSVDAGLILIDTMRAIESPVYCVVESKAYSMAAIILTFCERRYALDHATIMLHEASYGTAGEDPSIRSRLDFLSRYLDLLHVQIAKQLKMPVDVYRARIRDAWWLMADEAKKAGVIDEVVERIDYVTPATEQSETKTTVKLNRTQHDARPATKGAAIKKRR